VGGVENKITKWRILCESLGSRQIEKRKIVRKINPISALRVLVCRIGVVESEGINY